MPHRLELDRFEGPSKNTAVLLPESGDPILLPRSLLPDDAREGTVLLLSFQIDEAATKAVSEELAQVQHELKKTDPGGDLNL